MLWQILAYKGVRKLIESTVPDPLAANGEPVDLSWTDAKGHETQRVVHQVDMTLAQLQTFLPRLQYCFDRSLSDGQVQVLTNRVGRLRPQQHVMLHFSVRHRGEATTLDIGVAFAGAATYHLELRGTGAAMTVLADEVQAIIPAVHSTPEVIANTAPAAVVATVATNDGLSDDGILRLNAARSQWRALLPLTQGHFLGHPLFVTVENARPEADIQPQPSDHQLLTQIYAELPQIINQVMATLFAEISDPELLRQLQRPTIILSAQRVDPQSWSFSLSHAHDPAFQWTLPFRKGDKLR